MKTTGASVALAMCFADSPLPRKCLPPAEGMPAGPPRAVQLSRGPNGPLFGWIAPESGGKTPT